MMDGFMSNMFMSNRSLSPQPTVHAIKRHQKSVMPQLKGGDNQKYLHVFIYQTLAYAANQSQRLSLKRALENQFEDKVDIKQFSKKQQILKHKYFDDDLYYLIVDQKFIDWAQTFAENQRQGSNNARKIFAVGILPKSEANKKNKKKYKKINKKFGQYQFYYDQKQHDSYLPDLLDIMNQHLGERLRRQGQRIKTWNLSNKFKQKKVKKNTSHVYYFQQLQDQIQKLYHKNQNKMNNTWLQIHKFSDFRSIVADIQNRAKLVKKQINNQATVIKNVTSKLIPELTSAVNVSQMRSDLMSSKMIMSNISSLGDTAISLSKSLKILSKNEQNWILCPQYHKDFPKFKQFVKADKAKNWHLLQIDDKNNNFKKVLKQMIEKLGQGQQQQNQLLKDRIINSKTLLIVCKVDDQQTINLFNAQQNVLYNMQLLTYQEPSQFSLLLREGVRTFENFTIAIVPGQNGRPYGDYAKEIAQFNSQYQNFNYVENYEFRIQNPLKRVHSRFKSNISLLPQSNIMMNSNNFSPRTNQNIQPQYLDLQQLMKERDKNFHPFNGLKGQKVYLMYRANKQKVFGTQFKQLADKRARIQISSYIDKSFLQEAIRLKKVKNDSVIVLTDDDTLRQAQQVVKKFDQVYILNITDRKNVQNQIKVISHNTKPNILKLVQSIPQNQSLGQFQEFDQDHLGNQMTKQRDNRILPVNFDNGPGNNISIRMPADLNHPQSRKFQINLKKYFKEEIKFQYYIKPKDIRLANKLEQPMTFIIVTKKHLEEMKKIAISQKQQLRSQFIYYDENPLEQSKLIDDDKYKRFRFLSNKWSKIYEYIIGTMNPNTSTFIYSDQNIHLFIQNIDGNQQNLDFQNRILQYKMSDDNRYRSAKNIIIHKFFNIDDIDQTLQQMYDRDKYYLFINQVTGDPKDKNKINYTRAQGQHKVIQASSFYKKKLQMLIFATHIDHTIKKKKLKSVVSTEMDVQKIAEWISQIQYREIAYNKARPFIVIDHDTLDWYYYLDKYSQIWKKMIDKKEFQFIYLADRKDLVKAIYDRRQLNFNATFWILVKKKSDLQQYINIVQQIENNKKIQYIFNGKIGSGSQQLGQLRNYALFAHPDPDQIKSFIRNPFRTSYRTFFPSSVNQRKVMLMIFDSPQMYIKLEQKRRWRDDLGANVRTYDTIQKVYKAIDKYKKNYKNIYLVHDITSQKKAQKTLMSYPFIKRIVLSRKRDVRKLQDNFVEGNNPIFIGICPYQINKYLKNLRYNIRNSQQLLKKTYNQQIYYILLQNGIGIQQNQKLNNLLQLQNDSIVYIDNFDKNTLQTKLKNINPQYAVIVIGDSYIQQQVKRNRDRQNLYYLQWIANIDQNNSQDDGQQQSVIINQQQNKSQIQNQNQPSNDQISNQQVSNLKAIQYDQIWTYLFNLPQNRYINALQNKKFNIFYFDKNIKQLSIFLKLFDKIKQRNKAIKKQIYNNKEDLQALITSNKQTNVRNIIVVENPTQQKDLRNYFDKTNIYNLQYFILGKELFRNLVPTGDFPKQWFISRDRNKQYKSFLNNINEQVQPQKQNLQPQNLVPYPEDFDQMIVEGTREFVPKKLSNIYSLKSQYETVPIEIKKPIIPQRPTFLDTAEYIKPIIFDLKQFIKPEEPLTLVIKANTPDQPLSIRDVPQPNKNSLNPRLDRGFKPITAGINPSKPLTLATPEVSIPFQLPPAPKPKVKLLLAYPQKDRQLQGISKMWKDNLSIDRPNGQTNSRNYYQIQLQKYRHQREKNDIQQKDFDKMVFLYKTRFNKDSQKDQPKLYNVDKKAVLELPFDDNYYRKKDTVEKFLQPYNIRFFQNLPYCSPNLPLIKADKFKIYVPEDFNELLKYANPQQKEQDMTRRYFDKIFIDPQHRRFIEFITYSNIKKFKQKLSQIHGEQIHLIICSLRDYNQLKKLKKNQARRFIFVITPDIKQDQLLLDRHPIYSSYIGPDGIKFLRLFFDKVIFKPADDIQGVLYYNRKQPYEKYVVYEDPGLLPYQKDNYVNENQLFRKVIKVKYTPKAYRLVVGYRGQNKGPQHDIKQLTPKIYIEKDKQYQKQYINNYDDGGYLHSTKFISNPNISLKEITQRREQFKDKGYHDSTSLKALPIVFYGNAKDLQEKLLKQDSPCMVIYDSSNMKVKGLKKKPHQHASLLFEKMHIFEEVENYRQRWISPDGTLPVVKHDQRLQWKQLIFTRLFCQKVFDTFNDMQFFYLSNKATIDKSRNILFRTKQDLFNIYTDPNQQNLLMIIFVEYKDQKHIPREFYQEIINQDGRIKIILLKSEFQDNRQHMVIKFNQIDPVIYYIKRIQLAGRIDHVIFLKDQGQLQVFRKELSGVKHQFIDLFDVEAIAQQIKGDFKKVSVVCYQYQIPQISDILQKYSIRTKLNSNEQVVFYPITRLTSSINQGGSTYISSHNSKFYTKKQPHIQIIIQPQAIQKGQNIKYETHYHNGNTSGTDKQSQAQYNNQNHYQNHHQYTYEQKNPNNKEVISSYYQKRVETTYQPKRAVGGSGVNHSMGSSHQNMHSKKLQPSIHYIDQVNSSKDYDFDNQRYQYFRILYNTNLDPSLKRKLLKLSKNPNVFPILYKSIQSYQNLQKDPENLMIFMMDSLPQDLSNYLHKKDMQVYEARDSKIVLTKKQQFKSLLTKSNVSEQLATILEQQEQIPQNNQENDGETLGVYLKMIQYQKDRSTILKKIQKIEQSRFEDKPLNEQKMNPKAQYYQKNVNNYNQNIPHINQRSGNGYFSNQNQSVVQNGKLNIVSKIGSPMNLTQEQIQKIRKKIGGRSIVVLVEISKKKNYEGIFQRFNFLIQSYSNPINLQTLIRQKKNSLIIVIVDRKMLDRLQNIKKTYNNALFILENFNRDSIAQKYLQFIDGQVIDPSQMEMLLSQISKQNQRFKLNNDNLNLNSKLENKKGSLIDFSNTDKFLNGLGNTRNRRVNLFYRDNTQLKKLIQNIEGYQSFNAKFIPYSSPSKLKEMVNQHVGYSSIVIVYSKQTKQIEDFLSKKEHVFVIRFRPPGDLRQNSALKYLTTVFSVQQLQNYFERYLTRGSQVRSPQSYLNAKFQEKKQYKQYYPPNSFGTSPRFGNDGKYVPKNKDRSLSKEPSKRLIGSSSSKNRL